MITKKIDYHTLLDRHSCPVLFLRASLYDEDYLRPAGFKAAKALDKLQTDIKRRISKLNENYID